MVRIDCPECGGHLFYITEDSAFCIDDDCGWRTPECLCSSCRMDKCNTRESVLDDVIVWCKAGISAIEETCVDGYIDGIALEKIDLLNYEIKWLMELKKMGKV